MNRRPSLSCTVYTSLLRTPLVTQSTDDRVFISADRDRATEDRPLSRSTHYRKAVQPTHKTVIAHSQWLSWSTQNLRSGILILDCVTGSQHNQTRYGTLCMFSLYSRVQ